MPGRTKLNLKLLLPILAAPFALLAFAATHWGGPEPTGLLPTTAATGPAANAASVDFYLHRVQPILRSNCYRCHAGLNHRGGLRLDSQSAILRGGKEGQVLVPGHPEQSRLIVMIRHEGPPDDPKPMPPKAKLSDADIAAVTAWIQAGAIMPRD